MKSLIGTKNTETTILEHSIDDCNNKIHYFAIYKNNNNEKYYFTINHDIKFSNPQDKIDYYKWVSDSLISKFPDSFEKFMKSELFVQWDKENKYHQGIEYDTVDELLIFAFADLNNYRVDIMLKNMGKVKDYTPKE